MGLLLLPFALMVVLFALAPLAWVQVLSLRAEDGWSFARYAEVLGDRFFLDAFAMSLYLSWWSSVAGLIAALFAAASLRRVPGRVQDAVVAFANMAGNLTGVPLAFAFMILLGTNGTLTLLLREAGLAAGFDLYTREGLVLIYTYFQIPLAVLMLYPAFDGLDDDWSSAAALLGASPRQYWRHVALPVLAPAVLGTFILLFANAMGTYATTFALTQGNFNIVTVRIASLIAGDLFLEPELAAALAVLLTLLLVAVTILSQWLLRRRHDTR